MLQKDIGNNIVYSDGRVSSKSFNRYIKQNIDRWGYVVCSINQKKKRLHRLLAECFIPNPYNLPHINHINGNKLDNSIENLEWSNSVLNTQHAYSIGLYTKRKYARITEEDVKKIRKMHFEAKISQQVIANKYGTNQQLIGRILKYKTWKHI